MTSNFPSLHITEDEMIWERTSSFYAVLFWEVSIQWHHVFGLAILHDVTDDYVNNTLIVVCLGRPNIFIQGHTFRMSSLSLLLLWLFLKRIARVALSKLVDLSILHFSIVIVPITYHSNFAWSSSLGHHSTVWIGCDITGPRCGDHARCPNKLDELTNL